MATEFLSAELVAAKNSLDDALDEVESAARRAKHSLSRVNDELGEMAGVNIGAAESTDRTGSELSDLALSAGEVNIMLDQTSDKLKGVAASGTGASEAVDQTEEQAEEARNAFAGLTGTLAAVSGAFGLSAAASRKLAGDLDEIEEEADEMRNSLLAAAGASELLSLESSALSINIGFMTIALRNATTQVPALIGSLGNLVATLSAVGGAAIFAGTGLIGLIGAGVLQKTEQLAGDFQNMEDVMNALKAIGEEVGRTFLEALQPLREMEGAMQAFKSIVDTTAMAIQQMAHGFRRSFEAGEELFGLADFFGQLGQSLRENLPEIDAAFQTMMHNIGPIIADVLSFAMEKFDDFTAFASEVAHDMAAIFGGIDIDEFIENFILLGRQVGAGLVPVMNAFFGVMAELAGVINSLGTETIALLVQFAGMALIINSIIGRASALIVALAAIPRAMAGVIVRSRGLGKAFVNLRNKIKSAVLASEIGFTRMSNALDAVLPSVTTVRLAQQRFAESFAKSRRLGSMFASVVATSIIPANRGLISSLRASGTSALFMSTSLTSMGSPKASLSDLGTAAKGLAGSMKGLLTSTRLSGQGLSEAGNELVYRLGVGDLGGCDLDFIERGNRWMTIPAPP